MKSRHFFKLPSSSTGYNCNFILLFSCSDDGSCKHAVAVLFALADYIERNTDKGTAVGTDEPCTWTKPRKASMPVRVEDLDYRAERKTPRKPGPLPKHYKPLSNVNNSCILNIQERVTKVSHSRTR